MTKKKSLLGIIAILFGGWLVVDALFALTTGYYIGSGNPSMWADLLREVGIDPFEFAPGILSLGILWIISGFYVLLAFKKWRGFYGVTAVLTLWYLPIGTAVSLAALSLILSGLLPRQKQRTFISIVSVIASIIVTVVIAATLNLGGR